MERPNELLVQKKPWSEMTEEERQATRESWKTKLPEEYDVYCTEYLECKESMEIPGNLYVNGNVICPSYIEKIAVHGDCIIDGWIRCLATNVSVGGDFIVNGDAYCGDIRVGGDSIINKEVDCGHLYVFGNCTVSDDLKCRQIHVYHNLEVEGYLNCEINVMVQGKFSVKEAIYCKHGIYSGSLKH